jgi:hypothetical protein
MFLYPTATEFLTIEPELVARGRAGRLGIDLMPIRGSNFPRVRWTQMDNYAGLQQLRGLDGAPTHIQRRGRKQYEYTPGYFGEFGVVTETELNDRAGSVVDPTAANIAVGDIIAEWDDELINREFDRIESSNWAILTTGTITIKIDGPNGTQTGFTDTFDIQTYTAPITWATFATAVPLRNFQTVQQLGVGKGIDLGAGARAYMNTITFNNMINNQNANDLAGRRAEFGQTIDTLNQVNSLLNARGAPGITLYDDGYIPTTGGSFTKFIPDNKVVVIGRRASGAKIGEYLFTRNVVAGYRPVSYRFVKDYAQGINAPKEVPPRIEVHRGHNGGPVIYYPSAIVVMSV